MRKLTAALFAAFLAVTIAPPVGANENLRIGLVGPLTGDFAVVGLSQLNGAKLHAQALAKSDPSVKIELMAEDDTAKCDQSVNETTKLVEQEHVSVIFGATNSPCALAMVPITARDAVPQFTVGVGTAITKQGSKYIFRVSPSAGVIAQALADYAVGRLHDKRVAILYTNDEYGKSSAEGMRAALKSHGLEPAVFEAWTIGDKDFSGQLGKVQSEHADALYATGSIADAALIAKQARQMGLKVQILGDTGVANETYLKLGGAAVENAIVIYPFDAGTNDPKLRAFVEAYRATFNRSPNSWDAEMYDTLGMVYEAVKRTGKTDGKSIRDYIASLKPSKGYHGLMGEIWFDENGDSHFPLNAAQIKNGRFVTITAKRR